VKFILSCKAGSVSERGKKVAVIGAGVAGLGAAGYLYCRGYDIDVYDALPEAGGLLLFGIPDERLPKKGVIEGIDELKAAGVKFHLGIKVDSFKLEKIMESHDAVLIATGTWKAKSLRVPGADLEGVITALDFLVDNAKYRLGLSPILRKIYGTVGIMGGGYTAVDAVIEAMKWTDRIYVFYRRTIRESEARSEWESIGRKGVRIIENSLVTRVIGTKSVEGVEVWGVKMKGDVPEFIPNSGTIFPLDFLLVAIGEESTPPESIERLGIKVMDGRLLVDENMMTSRYGVFAAGDVVNGPTFIGNALASGLKAAKAMDAFLNGELPWKGQ
jgi:glutamate synthase (NADPH/NADH) small chain